MTQHIKLFLTGEKCSSLKASATALRRDGIPSQDRRMACVNSFRYDLCINSKALKICSLFIFKNTITIRVSIAYYKEQDLCKAAQKICQAYAEFAHVTPDSIFLENQSTNCYYH